MTKTGNDKEIQDYVLQFKEAHEFLDKLEDMINFLIPNYIAEGKTSLSYQLDAQAENTAR